MKNLLHHIQILVILALLMAIHSSCSNEWQDVNDVQVNFTATLPIDTHTRSFGKAEHINTLVAGVFNGLKEVSRQSFAVNGTSVDIQLTLPKNQTYNFVFWAYNNSSPNIYNIANLAAIKMNALPDQITFTQAEAGDAFFATMKEVAIMRNCSYPIELVRPLAQINIGTSRVPMKASFKVKAPETFYPLENTVSEAAMDYTWNFSETTDEKFLVDENEYNYLAIGYLFAPSTATSVAVELTLTDGEKSQTVQFPQVEIEANQRSNIVGKFTTE